jgi:hypothetical protein
MRESLPKRDFPDLTTPNTGLTEASYRKKFRVGVSTSPMRASAPVFTSPNTDLTEAGYRRTFRAPMQASVPVAGLCEAGGYLQRPSFS